MVTLLDKRDGGMVRGAVSNLRHPEKAGRPDTPVQRKPAWIRVKAPGSAGYAGTAKIVRENGLHTVCEEASCPNIGECWEKRHATMMIMGDTCTRACAFCNVKTGLPAALDEAEPEHVAEAVAALGLSHVVVTSVDRDDLADGGAAHIAATIRAIRAAAPATTIEVLTPDFLKKGDGALETVIAAKPDVCTHNLEIVPALHRTIRAGRALLPFAAAAPARQGTGQDHVHEVGDHVGHRRERNEGRGSSWTICARPMWDFLTIGQYLQPTRKHAAVDRFVEPAEFESYKAMAHARGFLVVASSRCTRSS